MKLARFEEIESKVAFADCAIMTDDELREILRMAKIVLLDQKKNEDSIVGWVEWARGAGHEIPAEAAKVHREHSERKKSA